MHSRGFEGQSMFCSRNSLWLVASLTTALSGCGTGNVESSRKSATTGTDERIRVDFDPTPAGQTDRAIERIDDAATVRPDDWFEDVTSRTQVNFTYQNGREANRFYLIETFGGGTALVDFDLDGDVDLFATGGGTIPSGGGSPEKSDQSTQIGGLPAGFYRNDRGWQFVEVTAQAGFAKPVDYSFACAVTDFNSDGFPDILVTCYGRSRLYVSDGDGTFQEIAEWARPAAEGLATAAAFGDVDGDGFPDLMLAFYADWSPEKDVECHGSQGRRDLCGPHWYRGSSCRFFHNSGDGQFLDWSVLAGIQGNTHGLGIVAADLNADGRVDFFVASDQTANQLYLGGPHLPLVEWANPAGVALDGLGLPVANMGIAIGDYNGDGRPDIFVTTYEREDSSLYRNLGDGLYVYSMMTSGLAGFSRMNTKFGTSLTDFDGDGWLDLFVLNGHTLYSTGESPFQQAPELFRNISGRRFSDVSPLGGAFFRQAISGRGNAVGDIDDDGAPDLVTTQINGPLQMQRNRLTPKNWVSVELHARRGERDATGARVTATYDGRRLVRFVTRGEGYFSQFDPRWIFPVGPGLDRAEVIVDWPGRGTERFPDLAVRRSHALVEGRGATSDE